MRAHKKQVLQEKIQRIEKLKSRDPKEYWKQLKALDSKNEKKDGIPKKVFDDQSEQIVGKMLREVGTRR